MNRDGDGQEQGGDRNGNRDGDSNRYVYGDRDRDGDRNGDEYSDMDRDGGARR
jgi:hypothetical protein